MTCAAALLPVLAAAAAPDLSGVWQFVPQHSDDVHAKVVDALGPAYTKGDIREDTPRVWIRDWLLRQADQPAELVLTVEQTATEFRSFLGDEVRIYYFGRETTRQGPGGRLRKATVRREGDRIVVEEKAVKASGRIVEAYEVQPDGRTLLVRWRLEHDAMHQPLELKLAFERAAQ